ncbi:hypothetical protein [Sphingobacterium endophyticum]|uniref:hypothetical protein n=1 Tax=Sphingobacterium endophyticum TaxID=2546448 RepID=UPI0012E19F8C|nr:hypothetical protein [Sphingobacterium endophyticum]
MFHFLSVLNPAQTIFSLQNGNNGITDGTSIASAISLGLLSLALWKKTPGLLWGSIAMYAAQLIYLFFLQY